MRSLWKFGGLTPLGLTRLTIKKIGSDELSTRSAALSYYFLLALFPMFLFLMSLIGILAGPGSELRENIISAFGRLAPGSASQLVHNVINQTLQASNGIKLAAGILGALWSASGGMSAVVTSLNVIYRVSETRPWWKQKLTIVGLTVALAALIITGLVLALYGGKIGEAIANHAGLGGVFRIFWQIIQWPAAFAVMLLAYSIIYYFAPNLDERRWYWVTPGAAAGVALWLLTSIGFRIYLHFFNSYSATYGSIGAVIILMLWLFMTGFAILVGGEINWVIEDAGKKTETFEMKMRQIEQDMKAA